MASIIKSDNGVSSGITGIVQSADSSGQLALQTTTSGGTATTAVTIDNTQKVTFANSIGFGSNAGITFNNSSALTNSTLNDYETGTWTPNQGAGLTVVGTFSSSGTYTKIGSMVLVNFRLNGSTSITVSAGGVLSSNLPFSTASSGAYFWGTLVNNTTGISAVQAASSSIFADTSLAATPSIYGSIVYQSTF
jgi:hypothetical protein